jgi:hypothetical protein
MMNHQTQTHTSHSASQITGGIRERLSAHPAMTLGIALGVGALLGVALSSRDKNLIVNVAHLVARLALVSTKGAAV